MIGIIFAMKEELDEFLKVLSSVEKEKVYDLVFYKSKLKDKDLILVESGIGKVNAARTTQVLIDKYDVDYIFNVGVAGGIVDSVNICDIVLGEKLVQHDFDLTAFNREKGDIPNVGKYIDSDSKLISICEKVKTKNKVFKGVIASGDIFCSEGWMSKKIATKFNALCVEMEGASIAQVCSLCKKPFLVIRSISDSPNKGNNKITYDEFLEDSSREVALYLEKIIGELD